MSFVLLLKSYSILYFLALCCVQRQLLGTVFSELIQKLWGISNRNKIPSFWTENKRFKIFSYSFYLFIYFSLFFMLLCVWWVQCGKYHRTHKTLWNTRRESNSFGSMSLNRLFRPRKLYLIHATDVTLFMQQMTLFM